MPWSCRFRKNQERLEDPNEIFFDEENVKGKDWRESGGTGKEANVSHTRGDGYTIIFMLEAILKKTTYSFQSMLN